MTYFLIGTILAVIYLAVEIKLIQAFEYEPGYTGFIAAALLFAWPLAVPALAFMGVIIGIAWIAEQLY